MSLIKLIKKHNTWTAIGTILFAVGFIFEYKNLAKLGALFMLIPSVYWIGGRIKSQLEK